MPPLRDGRTSHSKSQTGCGAHVCGSHSRHTLVTLHSVACVRMCRTNDQPYRGRQKRSSSGSSQGLQMTKRAKTEKHEQCQLEPGGHGTQGCVRILNSCTD